MSKKPGLCDKGKTGAAMSMKRHIPPSRKVRQTYRELAERGSMHSPSVVHNKNGPAASLNRRVIHRLRQMLKGNPRLTESEFAAQFGLKSGACYFQYVRENPIDE